MSQQLQMGSVKRLNESDQKEILLFEQDQQQSQNLNNLNQANVQMAEASEDDDDGDEDFINKFSNLNQSIQSSYQQQKDTCNTETKKLLKKVDSVYEIKQDSDVAEQAAAMTEDNQMNLSSSNDSDDDLIIAQLQFQSNQSVKYLNILKEINDEGYISIVIQSVLNKDQIPEQYWSVFQSVVNEDDTFLEKDIKNKYSIQYLKAKLRNNKELEEKLQTIEIGLLMVGSIYNEVQYDIDDSANFLGQFKYQQIKISQTSSTHLFFTILHSNEPSDRDTNAITDFFSTTNVLILEPDYVLYPTLIAQSISCYRTPLIKMKFCVTESTNWNMLKGTILHDIFEYLMEENRKKQSDLFISEENQGSFLQSIIRKLYTKYIEDLYLLGKTIEDFEKEIKYITKHMFSFIQQYLVNGVQYESKGSKRKIKILRLVENEMVVNNESLGLKGQIDCIFLCEVEESIKPKNSNKPEESTQPEKYKCFLPFELKTGGKKKDSYQDQSLFYCLLLNQKYHHKKNLEGFLYYLTFNEIISLSPTKKRTHALISRRNKLAKMIKKMENEGIMPDINPQRADICKFCYQKEACYSSQIAQDYDTLKDLEDVAEKYKLDKSFVYFHSIYDSMTEGSKLYLKKWLGLIQQEQQYDRDQKKQKKQRLEEIDNELTFNAQNFDNFFAFQLSQQQTGYSNISSSQNSMSQQSISSKNSSRDSQNNNCEDSETIILEKKFPSMNKLISVSEFFKEGESFVISQIDIKTKFKAILNEKIVCETSTSLILKLSTIQGQVNFDEKKMSKFLNKNQIGNYLKWNIESYNKDQYPDQRQNVLNLILNKIANQSDNHKSFIETYNLKQPNNNLISSIIDNFPPTFNNTEYHIESILSNYPTLLKNVDQADSIRKILKSDSLTCILGMPGTGKTFLIAHLIKILADQKKKILITSFTNSALDNIILKLFEIFPKIKPFCFRKGSNKNLIHPIAQEILYNPYSFKEQSEFKEYFNEKQIFFSTIIGANNKLFHSDKIHFDYCIIDEASQCVEPLCLGPILQCNKSVLIGDHYQLQPLVKCEEAGKQGLSISLFERLCKHYPNCYVELKSQFRMNNEIMELSNIMVYDGKLKAFDDNIAHRKLEINQVDLNSVTIQCLNHCIQPDNKVVFLDTSSMIQDLVVEEETINNPIQENRFQLKFICLLIKYLQSVGMLNRNIAIITPYNYFRIQLLKYFTVMRIDKEDLDIFTVDKSQGIDRDIIILHCSDKIGNDHLLSNWRRTNVALTRSKKKLILVGNKNTLYQYGVVCNLMGILEKKNYIYTLRQNEIQEIQGIITELENQQSTQSMSE